MVWTNTRVLVLVARYLGRQHCLLCSVRRVVEYSHRYRFVIQPLWYILAGGPPVCIHGVFRLSDREIELGLPHRRCPRCEWNACTSEQAEASCRWVGSLLSAIRRANRRLAALVPTPAPARLPY